MRDQLKYLQLWQQKRSELPVGDIAQTDWMEMRALLDIQMPVTSTVSSVKPGHIAKFKLLYILAAVLTAVAILYFALHYHTATRTNKHPKTEHVKDSILNSSDDRRVSNHNNVTGTPINTINVNTGTNGQPQVNSRSSAIKVKADSLAALKTNNTGVPVNTPVSSNSLSAEERLTYNKKNKVTDMTVNNKTMKPSHSVADFNANNIAHSPINSPANATLHAKAVSGYHKTNLSAPKHSYNKRGDNNNNNGQTKKITPGASVKNHNRVGANIRQNNMGSDRNNKQVSQIYPGANGLKNPTLIQPQQLQLNITGAANNPALLSKTVIAYKIPTAPGSSKTQVDKKIKSIKPKSNSASSFDWGILTGVNPQGSFTPKNQNANIYGSLPVDVYLGAFATYNFNNKWAINMQPRILNPHKVSGSYSHANESKIDTTQTLKITDSRKIYTADAPLYLVYNLTKNISIKGGPAISIPLKQVNPNAAFQTSKTKKDTTNYYKKVTDTLNNTAFTKRINYGITGGISLQYNRFSLDATYYHGLQTQKISSALGSYTTNTNGVQVTLGFRLNKGKH